MKKSVIVLIAAVLVCLLTVISVLTYNNSLNASNPYGSGINIYTEYDSTIPTFKDYGEPDPKKGAEFEVKKLEIAMDLINYKTVGKVIEHKFRIKATHLRYSHMYPSSQYTDRNGTWLADTPIYFPQNTKNAEGIIIFDGVPYSLYYDENGRAFVKCLEIRFNDYFKEDKPYSEFIKWAKSYTRRLDDEDLLSS